MSLLHQTIQLKTFSGTTSPKKAIPSTENYWSLIGENGVVIEENNDYFPHRVLVQFEPNLDDLDLIHHNPIKNTLWILISDLELTSQK